MAPRTAATGSARARPQPSQPEQEPWFPAEVGVFKEMQQQKKQQWPQQRQRSQESLSVPCVPQCHVAVAAATAATVVSAALTPMSTIGLSCSSSALELLVASATTRVFKSPEMLCRFSLCLPRSDRPFADVFASSRKEMRDSSIPAVSDSLSLTFNFELFVSEKVLERYILVHSTRNTQHCLGLTHFEPEVRADVLLRFC